jgi:hypothetical protein
MIMPTQNTERDEGRRGGALDLPALVIAMHRIIPPMRSGPLLLMLEEKGR